MRASPAFASTAATAVRRRSLVTPQEPPQLAESRPHPGPVVRRSEAEATEHLQHPPVGHPRGLDQLADIVPTGHREAAQHPAHRGEADTRLRRQPGQRPFEFGHGAQRSPAPRWVAAECGPMDADLVLGLDLGTTRTKALLLDVAGTEVAVAAGPTPFASEGSRIEMPVDRLLQATEHVVASLGADRERVAAVGLAGMAECGAPLDRSGAPVAPVIAWHDPRGTDVAERLVEQFGDALGLRTGQRPRSVSTVAKLGWLVANGTNALQRWLGVPELVLRSLTGAEVTEHSFASRTGCWDVVEMTWLEEVAAAAGFSVEVFGPVLPAGSAMGHIDAPTAERWGLPAGIPVTLAGHDHLAGAVGAGAGPGDLVNSVGTAETVLGTTTTAPDLRTALDLRTPVSVAPGGRGWVILAGAARAGVVLEAAAGRFGYGFAELDAMAEQATPVDATELATSLQA